MRFFFFRSVDMTSILVNTLRDKGEIVRKEERIVTI